MIKLAAMTRTHHGQAESFPRGRDQALCITKELTRSDLEKSDAGIHIQGTVIGVICRISLKNIMTKYSYILSLFVLCLSIRKVYAYD